MKHLRKKPSDPLYIPDYFSRSVHDIDFDALKQDGVKVVALDADNTLISFSMSPFHPKHIEDDLLKKLKVERTKFDMWIIASNHPNNDLQELATSVDAQVVRAGIFLRKPRREYFRNVIACAGVKPEEIAMVGDKLIADIYGANRMGLKSVLVSPLGSANPIDTIVQTRRIEKWLSRKHIGPSEF